ncbi:MAG: T9SS type A sorting domain-containing protein [Bacteroidales bacterium]|nr:T9SS type A sorting domain-containing protein [Bacteroidales bacterium]MCF8332846.1 T9SS type A sorting domain-containing protein [Bacteroidales bacterium]
MKKTILISLILMITGSISAYSQDTIAGWTFPTGTTDDKYCNLGTDANVGSKDLRATDIEDNAREITYTETNGDYAAKAVHWENGKDTKYWMVRFDAENYKDITINSKQRSAGANPGPRDFAVDYKLGSAGDWQRLDTVVVKNDWTTGVVENLALPEISDTYPNTISVRWIMISDTSAYDSEVFEDGISWIDDIMITGTYVEPNPDPILAGWSFPNAFSTEYTPDTSIAENSDFELELINDNIGDAEAFNLGSGYSTYAAYASGWSDMSEQKYWMVKFKTDGYVNVYFSSRQSSKSQYPGPGSFVVQYRVGGGEWTDIEGAQVQVDDSWNTGVLENVSLPEICWDTTASVYLRWLSTSNTDFNGNALTDEDVSIIDDIRIRGEVNTIGTEDIEAPDKLDISPVPADDKLYVSSDEKFAQISVFSLRGKQIKTIEAANVRQLQINVANINPGPYVLRIKMEKGYIVTRKIVVM